MLPLENRKATLFPGRVFEQLEAAMKILRLAVVLIIAGLFLAGCTFQAETQVAADGSGSLRTEVGFTSEERQSLEQQSGNNNSKDFCNSENSRFSRINPPAMG